MGGNRAKRLAEIAIRQQTARLQWRIAEVCLALLALLAAAVIVFQTP